MHKRLLELAVVLLFAGSGFAQNTVSFAGGRLALEIPDGLHMLTAEDIALKFPSASPPQYVYANPRGGVSIAIPFSRAEVAIER